MAVTKVSLVENVVKVAKRISDPIPTSMFLFSVDDYLLGFHLDTYVLPFVGGESRFLGIIVFAIIYYLSRFCLVPGSSICTTSRSTLTTIDSTANTAASL